MTKYSNVLFGFFAELSLLFWFCWFFGGMAGRKLPSGTSFKQQKLRACTPILTPLPVIGTFLVLGIVFIPIGVILLDQSRKVEEYRFRYDEINACDNPPTNCDLTIEIKKKMKAPVFFYYGLSNYNQNHRRYVKSRQDDQLAGRSVKNGEEDMCDPVTYASGDEPKSERIYVPCGLIAQSTFNDSFILSRENGQQVEWTKNGVAWESDLDTLFGSYDDEDGGVLMDPPVPGCEDLDNCTFTDPDFVVWMRVAALPTFRKLYRVINSDLERGNYTVNIENNYPVSEFDGEKRIIISTSSWIGGKNDFLGITYLVVGSFSFVMGVAFLIKHKISPRKFGDISLIDWMGEEGTANERYSKMHS